MSENEKNPVNCIQCNYLKESMQKFSCNHLICKECLCLLLIENEFNHNQINIDISNISLQCPECLPKFKSIEKCPNLTLSYFHLYYHYPTIQHTSNTSICPLISLFPLKIISLLVK